MPTPVLINCQGLSKAFGERPLFEELSFALHEGDHVGAAAHELLDLAAGEVLGAAAQASSQRCLCL